MKMHTRTLLAIGLLWVVASAQARILEPFVIDSDIYQIDDVAIVQLFGRVSPENPLRSAGLRVGYDPDQLSLRAVHPGFEVWYFANEMGERVPYIGAQDTGQTVDLLLGNFDAMNPRRGVSGERFPIATLIFQLTGDPSVPRFEFLELTGSFAGNVYVGGEEATLYNRLLVINNPILRERSPDRDRDGIADDWEIDNFGDLTSTDGTGDADFDGIKDKDEWIAGTDPNDPDSKLVARLREVANGVELSWTSAEGRIYRVLRSDDLGGFSQLIGGLLGAPPVDQIVDTDGLTEDRLFYRVGVDYPAALLFP